MYAYMGHNKAALSHEAMTEPVTTTTINYCRSFFEKFLKNLFVISIEPIAIGA